MLPRISRVVCALAVLFLFGATSTASAQYYQPGGNPCQCAQPVAQVYQPVAQTCYQTVPVTEYQQVKRTVQRPVVETKYVDQQVTEYRQVVEAKTVEVPTVAYQNVTECQTVQRDLSYWATRQNVVPKVAPCQYDNRPGLVGEMNRIGYAFRSAFTPSTYTTREYVPNVVAQTVPVTRQVAIRGTKQMTYNVAKMVPYTTTRKVAVNSVKYVAEEITENRPVTVMRTVPIGTRTAYTYLPYGATAPQTVLAPAPDPVSGARAAEATVPKRTAETKKDAFGTDSSATDAFESTGTPATRSSFIPPVRRTPARSDKLDGYRVEYHARAQNNTAIVATPRSVPSIVRVSGWKTRSLSPRETSRPTNVPGPVLPPQTISLAGNTP